MRGSRQRRRVAELVPDRVHHRARRIDDAHAARGQDERSDRTTCGSYHWISGERISISVSASVSRWALRAAIRSRTCWTMVSAYDSKGGHSIESERDLARAVRCVLNRCRQLLEKRTRAFHEPLEAGRSQQRTREVHRNETARHRTSGDLRDAFVHATCGQRRGIDEMKRATHRARRSVIKATLARVHINRPAHVNGESPRAGSGNEISTGDVSSSNTSRYGPSKRSMSPVCECPTTIAGRTTVMGTVSIARRINRSALKSVSSITEQKC